MANKIFTWRSTDGYGESSGIVFANNADEAIMLFRKSDEYKQVIHNAAPEELMDELCGSAKSKFNQFDLFHQKLDEMFSNGKYPSKDYFTIEELDETEGPVIEIGNYWE